MSYDLLIVERGDGGDLVPKVDPNGDVYDFELIQGFQNAVYLALFGGNVRSNTKELSIGEQRFDWWGNTTLFSEQPFQQMNSNTERTLLEIVTNSQGRLVLEQAVIEDLNFMREFAEVGVLVTFPALNRVKISVTLVRLDNQEQTQFDFLWDATLQELEGPTKYVTV